MSQPPSIESVHELPVSRRGVLLAGVGLLLTGCASTPQSNRTAGGLPNASWVPGGTQDPTSGASVSGGPFVDFPSTPVTPSQPAPYVPAGPPPAPSRAVAMTYVPRRSWAAGAPVPSLMNPMRPVHYITIHHDGMDIFRGTGAAAAASRLEAIRRGHRNRGWGDVGYHFAVDREGRIWEGRSLAYQGAHVKDRNPGNVGIVALGNFERQQPTDAQVAALVQHVQQLRQAYGVGAGQVRTHREWAATLCPGRSLQMQVDGARSRRVI